MAGAKSLASLSPTLLARKGGARPAIRSGQQELVQAGEADSKVVTLNTKRKVAPAGKPNAVPNAVRRQRAQLADQIAKGAKSRPVAKTATAKARPAAFTVRLDADRHLRLRLASALAGRSAQHLVVEALDSMLATLPELAELAARAGQPLQFPQKGDTP